MSGDSWKTLETQALCFRTLTHLNYLAKSQIRTLLSKLADIRHLISSTNMMLLIQLPCPRSVLTFLNFRFLAQTSISPSFEPIANHFWLLKKTILRDWLISAIRMSIFVRVFSLIRSIKLDIFCGNLKFIKYKLKLINSKLTSHIIQYYFPCFLIKTKAYRWDSRKI